MAKAPKPWKLSENETFSSFTNWQSNLTYVLSQETNFSAFLAPDVLWGKSSVTDRGLTAVGSVTAPQRAAHLNQMLGLIAQWVPNFLSNDIVKNSTCLDDVWNFVRKYYGFQQSETNFMKLQQISWEEGERPERLYQRVLAHLQDNLLTKGCKLKHDGATVASDEIMSPTVERLAVLRWMELINPKLPNLVSRTFAYDLQRMTLKDIQPQIVDALDGFLAEIKNEEITASRVNFRSKPFSKSQPKSYSKFQPASKPKYQPSHQTPVCRLCKAENRPSAHRLVDCDHITRAERKSLIRSCETYDDSAAELSEMVDDFALRDDEDDAE